MVSQTVKCLINKTYRKPDQFFLFLVFSQDEYCHGVFTLFLRTSSIPENAQRLRVRAWVARAHHATLAHRIMAIFGLNSCAIDNPARVLIGRWARPGVRAQFGRVCTERAPRDYLG